MRNLFLIVLLLCFFQLQAQEIPNTSLEDMKGKTINMQDLLNSDNLKVLSFWATWCVPCINELDAIAEIYDEWQEVTNVEIIAISTDDSRTKKRVKPLVHGKGWEYQILLDDNQELKRALNIATLPHVVLVKDGKIVYRHSGYVPGGEDELFEVIQKFSN